MAETIWGAYSQALRSHLPRRRLVLTVLIPGLVVIVLLAAGWVVLYNVGRTSVTAYFESANGVYVGDRVNILGVPVGKIDDITAEADGVRVRFHFDSEYEVPATAKAVILSQSLVTARAIQLTPGYRSGPKLSDGATIGMDRTAVPLEWDDLRGQLERVAKSLEPTEQAPAGPLGGFINSSAESLSGKGDQINDTLTQLSAAMKTMSDGRTDLFATVRNLQVFVSALAASDRQIVQANTRLAGITDVLTNTDDELGQAIRSMDAVAPKIDQFIAENRDGLKQTVTQLGSVTTALNEQRPSLEQLLHVAPNALANFYNIYQPAQGTLTGALAVTQFANPVQFICGAVQSASQLGAEESAKLCAQYLGPVLKTLQFNYPPVGVNPVAGVQARPEQVDYSEGWLREVLGDRVADKARAAGSAKVADGLPGLLGLVNPSVRGGR